MPNRYKKTLDALLASVERRYGQEKIERLKVSLKKSVWEATDRELVVQLIAQEKWWSRLLLLTLYPRYILPYLIRIRRTSS